MLFDKPFDDVGPEDLQSIIDRGLSESDTVEFKGDLTTDGRASWVDRDRLTDAARTHLLKEIVGLANSLGGNLILGVTETDDSPPRAHELNPIPRCEELARRLSQQAGSCIEPQIPRIRFKGVPTMDDGGGVVVASVKRSPIAPHRLKQTNDCYTRRGENTERMTMREIRDLVFTTRDLSDYIERRFTQADELFAKEFNSFANTADDVRAVSITAVPQDPDRIYLDTHYPLDYLRWRPMMRGAMGFQDVGDGDQHLRLELLNNGDVRLRAMLADDRHAMGQFYPGWFAGLFVAVCSAVDRVRDTSHELELRYGIDVRWKRQTDDRVVLMGWTSNAYIRNHDQRSLPLDVRFPRYMLGRDLSESLNLFLRDMWNLVGVSYEAEVTWTVQ